jgi:transcriptional regulator with XRE-family HTH domain
MIVNLRFINTKIYEKSITHVALAKTLNIGRNTLYRKLKGYNAFQIQELNKLANILEVPVYSLFDNSDNNSRFISNQTLKEWHDLLLVGKDKEVIKSIAEVIYGTV